MDLRLRNPDLIGTHKFKCHRGKETRKKLWHPTRDGKLLKKTTFSTILLCVPFETLLPARCWKLRFFFIQSDIAFQSTFNTVNLTSSEDFTPVMAKVYAFYLELPRLMWWCTLSITHIRVFEHIELWTGQRVQYRGILWFRYFGQNGTYIGRLLHQGVRALWPSASASQRK